MKKVSIFIFFILVSFGAFSQGEIDTQSKMFYRNEKTGAIFLTSSGLSLNYRYAQRQNARNKKIYDIEIGSVKHPKETKLSVPQLYNTRSFVFGKVNSVFMLNPGIGFQQELYRKIDKGGISIRYFYAGGPSLAIYKPIYYEVLTNVFPGSAGVSKVQKFDESIQHAAIFGRAGFFKGIKEVNVIPGAFFKIGSTFEYGTTDELIHAIELGVGVNAFIKELPIMAIERNPQVLISLFVGYRFGKVIDPTKSKTNIKKERLSF